ncbi:MAG: hypothetical protein H6Q70_92 [Firmicutes bacterium]|nr:hypothetical protein [Bacillota bacterium]
MDEESSARKKILKTALVIILLTYSIGNWIATQFTASDCAYNEILGVNLMLGQFHLYPPYAFYFWKQDEILVKTISHILAQNDRIVDFSILAGFLLTYFVTKGMRKNVSHGSASFATANEIKKARLDAKESGVVVGINPYTNKLMLDDNDTHVLLVAPTRGGKGVNTIIPTGLIWKHSIFFFDVKAELWEKTAGYRREALKQKVMKFEPLCVDGSTARWNPLAEINFRTAEEFSDVQTIVSMLVKPDGEKKGGDPFWDNSTSALLNGCILHLLYQHYQEKKVLPCPTDIMSFISSPDKDTEELFEEMRRYPHISKEEFLELTYVDKETGEKKQHVNVLKEIYGEYIRDFTLFNETLNCNVRSLDELREVIKKHDDVDFEDEDSPFYMLLTHPKVAEAAANMLNTAEQTRGSIMLTAQTALALYQNPTVQRNTAVSDFCIRDLLDPSQAISMYLVMQVDDVETLKPLSRLFINTLLAKLIRDMKFDADERKRQRLLLMLDEFPQLGCLKKMELALAVCAGYGIKVCIVSQDVNQLNKEYTKDNSIASNCHTHIYFTPNLDTGGTTAETISKALGKKTIATSSHSDGGGLLKGSSSKSYTGRDLMTSDEVAHMDSERELVFVAGQKPILGKKLRYYKQPFFEKRILPRPLYSDTATCIQNYDQLFAVHAVEYKDKLEKKRIVQEAKAREGVKNAAYIQAENIQKSKPEQSKQDEWRKETVEGSWSEASGKMTSRRELPEEASVSELPKELLQDKASLTSEDEKLAGKEVKVAALMQNFMEKYGQDEDVEGEKGDAMNVIKG